MVPEGWKRWEYGEVCTINRENLSPSTDPQKQILYLDIGSISEVGKIEGFRRYRFENAPSRARRVVQGGDVVVSTVRPYLKAFALISDPPDDLVASTGFAVLTPSDALDPEFLFHTVCAHAFVAQLEARMVGSNYPAVNISDVAEATLLIPPREEQESIARILTSVDDAIAATRRVIEQTKRVKKGLLRDLMSRGIGHARFKRTEIGEIPENWLLVPLEKLLAERGLRNGFSPPTASGPTDVPTFSIDAVRDGEVRVTEETVKYADVDPSEVADYRLKSGDVLLMRGNANSSLVGTVGIAREFPVGTIFPDILIRIPLNSRIRSRFFVEAWNSETVRRQIAGVAQTTSGTLKINQRQARNVLVPLPPLEEQDRILAVVSAAKPKWSAEALAHLADIKRGLMQDLLTGRVRVNVD